MILLGKAIAPAGRTAVAPGTVWVSARTALSPVGLGVIPAPTGFAVSTEALLVSAGIAVSPESGLTGTAVPQCYEEPRCCPSVAGAERPIIIFFLQFLLSILRLQVASFRSPTWAWGNASLLVNSPNLDVISLLFSIVRSAASLKL